MTAPPVPPARLVLPLLDPQVAREVRISFSHGASFRAADRIYPCITRKYGIHSGRRTVSIQTSVSALQAVVDYVRTFGCSDDEIRRLGVDAVAWRGARFSAVPVPSEQLPAE